MTKLLMSATTQTGGILLLMTSPLRLRQGPIPTRLVGARRQFLTQQSSVPVRMLFRKWNTLEAIIRVRILTLDRYRFKALVSRAELPVV